MAGSAEGWNLASGAIRSGKSYAFVMRLLHFILKQSRDNGEVLISAKRLDSIRSNIIRPLRKLIGMENVLAEHFTFHENSDPIIYQNKGKRLVINAIGANDESAEERIRGMTLQAWFPDELTLHPQGFVTHAIGRLSAEPRLLVATTNPESKSHHVYQNFVANGRAKVWNFTINDNPSLTPEYIRDVSDFYKTSPTYYARFILGEWAGDPECQVIPEWYEAASKVVVEHKRPRFIRPTVGMDVGMRDFQFVVFGYYDFENDIAVIEDEYMSRGETTDLIAAAIKEKEESLGYVDTLRYSDTDLRLIADMSRLHNLSFVPTPKDNKQAQINALRMAIAGGKLRINPRCENLIRHLDGAIWNDKKTEYERTERDGHFDGVDAAVYFYRNLNKSNPIPARLPEWDNPGMMVSPKMAYNNTGSSQEAEWEKAFQ